MSLFICAVAVVVFFKIRDHIRLQRGIREAAKYVMDAHLKLEKK